MSLTRFRKPFFTFIRRKSLNLWRVKYLLNHFKCFPTNMAYYIQLMQTSIFKIKWLVKRRIIHWQNFQWYFISTSLSLRLMYDFSSCCCCCAAFSRLVIEKLLICYFFCFALFCWSFKAYFEFLLIFFSIFSHRTRLEYFSFWCWGRV